MSITLCGFALSNYVNKVKLVLLEKGLPFAEELVAPGQKPEDLLSASPLGKVPFIRTELGTLCESSAIVEYLEALAPTPALLPAEPWAAAKVRELALFIDLHLELVARELYTQAFFGGTIGDSQKARVRKLLDRNIPAFKRLASFDPFVAGDTFTIADCAAYVTLPLVALSSKIIYGEDLLAAHGVDWKSYSKLVAQRPSAQRVDADRKAYQDQERARAGA
ncbi:MAG: glutathione S-transferase [Pseudomonadota bacterium]